MNNMQVSLTNPSNIMPLSGNSHLFWREKPHTNSSINFFKDKFEIVEKWIYLEKFHEALENKVFSGSDKKAVPFLKLMLRFMDDVESMNVKAAIKKQNSYFSRLFSKETWAEWLEDKTEFGKIIYLAAYYIQNPNRNIANLLEQLTPEIIIKANETANGLFEQIFDADAKEKVTANMPSFLNWIWEAVHLVDKNILSLISFPGAMADDGNDSIRAQEIYKQNKEMYDRYKKEYDKECIIERDQAFKKCASETKDYYYQGYCYYSGQNNNKAPEFATVGVQRISTKGEEECVGVSSAFPGYCRWSIFRRTWGFDQAVAERSFNYDQTNDKPNVETYSPSLRFCK